ncbi:transcriptional regulator (plasmid) [Halopseudomonas sp. SMJS2]|uniref:histone-like nucleoid-structuring protein, MvaT/MvaU family n=1 Tax=Halopseudomonas sp. SMJS2 TaxID=3041098 RepID=UPI00245331AB|nr:histone-like nucleoid-structuring protein, MvaT/MvaU family [Halopseudomonas sp. SMJS2]WGK63551.1 transcriptional regulator [Halopseudomonas sp. SMJS2]
MSQQLAAYRALQREIADLAEKQHRMEQNQELAREIEFEQKLKALVAESGLSKAQVISILIPDGKQTPAATGTRKPRKTKTYKNPHTGEVIETKGGNHKGLKVWKDKHGADVVNSWVV